MKSALKAKFLQHLASKKRNGGFTLIELLVVIIIIGILAAIALPSFLNQANKAKQSEAKTYVGSANRAQQAYFLENNEFAPADKFAELGLGVKVDTTNYNYSIKAVAGTAAAPAKAYAFGSVKTASAPLKAYGGGVVIAKLGAANSQEATSLAILCEAKEANTVNGGTQALAEGDLALTSTGADCAGNSKAIK